jgi:hypothetical protein
MARACGLKSWRRGLNSNPFPCADSPSIRGDGENRRHPPNWNRRRVMPLEEAEVPDRTGRAIIAAGRSKPQPVKMWPSIELESLL